MLVAGALALSACAGPPGGSRTAVVPDPGHHPALTLSDEQLGSLARDEFTRWVAADRQRALAPPSSDTVARIVSAGRRVAGVAASIRPAAAQWAWDLHVVADGDDAWCLPGGLAVVGARLAERLSDDALAAVIAHAIAHALVGHARERIPMIADPAHPYRQTAESEADRYGVELAARAGVDPRSLAQAIQSIEAAGAGASGWLRVHPPYPGRLTDLETYSARVLPFFQSVRR